MSRDNFRVSSLIYHLNENLLYFECVSNSNNGNLNKEECVGYESDRDTYRPSEMIAY